MKQTGSKLGNHKDIIQLLYWCSDNDGNPSLKAKEETQTLFIKLMSESCYWYYTEKERKANQLPPPKRRGFLRRTG